MEANSLDVGFSSSSFVVHASLPYGSAVSAVFVCVRQVNPLPFPAHVKFFRRPEWWIVVTGELLALEQEASSTVGRTTPTLDAEPPYPWAIILIGTGIGLAAGAVILLAVGRGGACIRILFALLAALLGGLVSALYRSMR